VPIGTRNSRRTILIRDRKSGLHGREPRLKAGFACPAIPERPICWRGRYSAGALGESQPTTYEKGLLEGIHAQADAEGNRQGAEAVFATLFFALQNANSKTLSADAKRAFDRLWSLQIREGKERGAWKWPNANHDP